MNFKSLEKLWKIITTNETEDRWIGEQVVWPGNQVKRVFLERKHLRCVKYL